MARETIFGDHPTNPNTKATLFEGLSLIHCVVKVDGEPNNTEFPADSVADAIELCEIYTGPLVWETESGDPINKEGEPS